MRSMYLACALAAAGSVVCAAVPARAQALNDLLGIRSGAPAGRASGGLFWERTIYTTNYQNPSGPRLSAATFPEFGNYSVCSTEWSPGDFVIDSAPVAGGLGSYVYVLSAPTTVAPYGAPTRAIFRRRHLSPRPGAQGTSCETTSTAWERVNMGEAAYPCSLTSAPAIYSVPAVVSHDWGGPIARSIILARGDHPTCGAAQPSLPFIGVEYDMYEYEGLGHRYIGRLPDPPPLPNNEVAISAPAADDAWTGLFAFVLTRDASNAYHLRHAHFDMFARTWGVWFDMALSSDAPTPLSAPSFHNSNGSFWLTYTGVRPNGERAIVMRHAVAGGCCWDPWQTIMANPAISTQPSRPVFFPDVPALQFTAYALSGNTPLPYGPVYSSRPASTSPPTWSTSWWPYFY